MRTFVTCSLKDAHLINIQSDPMQNPTKNGPSDFMKSSNFNTYKLFSHVIELPTLKSQSICPEIEAGLLQ